MKKIFETDSEVFLKKEPDPELVSKIQSHYNLTNLTSSIIVNRGLSTLEEVKSFLTPALIDLPDPLLFQDMAKAVERIYKAISDKESILIYGDYDVDGITSTTLLINFFEYIEFPVRYYIPNRFRDGYGLNLERLLQINDTSPFQLLITVDCGISSTAVIKELSTIGIDTIVTDHHLVESRPEYALGVINPSVPECHFPFKELAGVGVVFYLIIALRSLLREKRYWGDGLTEPDLKKSLDIVSIGTIADLVPLKGVNRILVNAGLAALSRTENTGLKCFLKGLGLYNKNSISPWEIAFQIAPRFNAAGRMDDASIGVSLLTTKDDTEAWTISKKLEILNERRQRIERELLAEADKKVKSDSGFISPFSIVLWGDKWHEGVIGIVASKLVEKYGRPIILISLNEDYGKGSLRGIPGIDIFKAMIRCKDLLLSFGGHPMAGGIRIRRKNLWDFARRFSEAVEEQSGGQIPKKRWLIDAIIDEEGLPGEFFSELKKLEPFGIGNSPPLLYFCRYEILKERLINERHIRLTFKMNKGQALQGIAFNATEYWGKIGKVSAIVGEPEINYWNGNEYPQIKIKKFLL